MFTLLWRGAEVELHRPTSEAASLPGRRDSPAAITSPNVPSLHALGIEPGLRRSISLKRRDIEPRQPGRQVARQSSGSDSIKSPNLVPSLSGSLMLGRAPSPVPFLIRPKWSRIMINFAAFFEVLTKSVAIPTDVFKEAVAVACLVLGQDPEDGLALDAEQSASELISLILGQAAGRRGENAIRMVLEGRIIADLKLEAARDVLIDACATRGAVM